MLTICEVGNLYERCDSWSEILLVSAVRGVCSQKVSLKHSVLPEEPPTSETKNRTP